MDLNELFFRHQVALIQVAHSPSRACREWAEQCSDYYATRIVSLRRRLGAQSTIDNHPATKRLLHG